MQGLSGKIRVWFVVREGLLFTRWRAWSSASSPEAAIGAVCRVPRTQCTPGMR